MITRLRVAGFKNLVDTSVRFGPLTCLAGPNGVGKSNIFDAIRFMSLLADKPFVEAARAVRGGDELRQLFTGGAPGRIDLEADLIIPRSGFDDFGQPAEASATFLRYGISLEAESDHGRHLGDRLRLVSEELAYIPRSEASHRLGFDHTRAWRDSVVRASTRRTSFISTENTGGGESVIRLQSDRMLDEKKVKRGGGKPVGFSAVSLPRSVLSSAQNAEEHRTAVLVRQELRRWRQLQLEPSALRQSDEFQSPDRVDVTGAHVPATLYRLAHEAKPYGTERIYSDIANRLAQLVTGVGRVRVDRDEAHRTLKLMLEDREGLELPASALSDGTMRFIALAVIERDPLETGVICIEEPENGIHPQRIDAMIRLLYDISVDVNEPVNRDNPIRQVIVTTHSPQVARRIGVGDLVFARQRRHRLRSQRLNGLEVCSLPDTWRAQVDAQSISLGTIIRYLQGASEKGETPYSRNLVMDRFQLELFR